MGITKEESLEKYKQHLKENVTYMGVGQAVLDLIESNIVAKFAISFLTQEVYGLDEESKELKKDLLWVIEKSMFGNKAPVTAKEFYEKCQELLEKHELKSER